MKLRLFLFFFIFSSLVFVRSGFAFYNQRTIDPMICQAAIMAGLHGDRSAIGEEDKDLAEQEKDLEEARGALDERLEELRENFRDLLRDLECSGCEGEGDVNASDISLHILDHKFEEGEKEKQCQKLNFDNRKNKSQSSSDSNSVFLSPLDLILQGSFFISKAHADQNVFRGTKPQIPEKNANLPHRPGTGKEEAKAKEEVDANTGEPKNPAALPTSTKTAVSNTSGPAFGSKEADKRAAASHQGRGNEFAGTPPSWTANPPFPGSKEADQDANLARQKNLDTVVGQVVSGKEEVPKKTATPPDQLNITRETNPPPAETPVAQTEPPVQRIAPVSEQTPAATEKQQPPAVNNSTVFPTRTTAGFFF